MCLHSILSRFAGYIYTFIHSFLYAVHYSKALGVGYVNELMREHDTLCWTFCIRRPMNEIGLLPP